jgi:hypothetical protein
MIKLAYIHIVLTLNSDSMVKVYLYHKITLEKRREPR